MKTRCQATALVVTLSLLMLLTAISVAFFTQVTTESKSAKAYSDSVTTQQLADSAVSLVMSQIREATTVENGAWGSQPGMIRVFGDGGKASNKVHAFYKLYSSNNMVMNPNQAQTMASKRMSEETPFGPGKGWNHNPALFTDLNQPIERPSEDGSGDIVKKYPILDPKIAGDNQRQTSPDKDGEADSKGDKKSWMSQIVEGFYIQNLGDDNDSGEIAPMPVRWLYMLKDGTLTAPESAEDGGVTAVWSGGATAPTKQNPIVGRIAFWTDDDSCKVNINTAGGFSDINIQSPYTRATFAGTYWDTPRFHTKFDKGEIVNANPVTGDFPIAPGGGGMATAQPAQREYQRYPGHPATTSLGLVFGPLLTSEQIYRMTPRYSPSSVTPLKGSMGGTQRSRGPGEINGAITSTTADDGAMDNKFDRLYANVEEMLFSSQLDGNGKRKLNDEVLGLAGKTITPERLDQLRFFMTAHSRSPDLNVFGRPRISIWPMWSEANKVRRSTFDSMIRFCSTIDTNQNPPKLYSFERMDPNASDENTSSKMVRNAALMEILQDLTNKPVPGYSRNDSMTFYNKYPGGDRDQILTEIFDYIRSTNLKDANKSVASGAVDPRFSPTGFVVPTVTTLKNGISQTKGFGRFPTISEAALVFYNTWEEHQNWWVAPPLSPTIPDPDPTKAGPVVANWMRAFVLLENFNPSMGYAPVSSPSSADFIAGRCLAYELTFKQQGADWSVKDSNDVLTSLQFPAAPVKKKLAVMSGSTWGGRNYGGLDGFMHTMIKGSGDGPYPFHSGGTYYGTATMNSSQSKPTPGVRMPDPAPTDALENGRFLFTGGELEVKISFAGTTNKPNLVQKMTLKFDQPSQNWRVPTNELWRASAATAAYNASTKGSFDTSWGSTGKEPGLGTIDKARNLETRLTWATRHSSGVTTDDPFDYSTRWRQILQPGDTVKSLEPSGGPTGTGPDPSGSDYRIVALYNQDGKAFNSNSRFRKHNFYDSDVAHAQSLRMTDGQIYFPKDAPTAYYQSGVKVDRTYQNTTAFGKLVNASGSYSSSPDVPQVAATGVVNNDGQPGDWDTAFGTQRDGAYINKVDEGNFVYRRWNTLNKLWEVRYPYYDTGEYEAPGDTYFSPNRQIPSAVMFGSLPSRALAGRGWETLCFNPAPAATEKFHYGIANPEKNLKDHLLLDLFTMPVVEPYAISEPLSTAGRVNLNYQIEPFRYIRRSTALRAALHPLRVMTVPAADINKYKSSTMQTLNYRIPVDRDQTIKGFDGFFKTADNDPTLGFFKTASEVCDRFLYPAGTPNGAMIPPAFYNNSTETSIKNFWRNQVLSGDNIREKPYADLLPRVTAKSNTYTVHMRVQVLRQPAGATDSDYQRWKQTSNSIAGEYRGETTIERYVDPEDPELANGDNDPDKYSMEKLYRFRVIYNKRFIP